MKMKHSIIITMEYMIVVIKKLMFEIFSACRITSVMKLMIPLRKLNNNTAMWITIPFELKSLLLSSSFILMSAAIKKPLAR